MAGQRLAALQLVLMLSDTVPVATGTAACGADTDCSLNGVCSSGSCACDPGWAGESCATLKLGRAPLGGVYGFGTPFAITSWGGNAIWDNTTALWHLFVTDIGGANCGLHGWSGGSTVAHATSKDVLGPYTKQDIALPHEAHNPQTIRLADGNWYIWHIGAANGKNSPRACNETGSGQPPRAEAESEAAAHAEAAEGQQGKSVCPAAPPTYTRTDAACISNTGCKVGHCSCNGARQLSSGDCASTAACVQQGSRNCTLDERCHAIAVRSDCSTGGGGAKRWSTFAEGRGSAVPNTQWVVYTRAGGKPPSPAPAPAPAPPSPPPKKTGSTVHTATSPAGPWEPVQMLPANASHCNNPSPFLHPNGTLYLACTWILRRSLSGSAAGPWSDPWPIITTKPTDAAAATAGGGGDGGGGGLPVSVSTERPLGTWEECVATAAPLLLPLLPLPLLLLPLLLLPPPLLVGVLSLRSRCRCGAPRWLAQLLSRSFPLWLL